MPVLDKIQVTVVKPKEKPLVELDDEVHKFVLQKLFDGDVPNKYNEFIAVLLDCYASEGYKQGTNAGKTLMKALTEKKIIVREEDVYCYHPESFSDD